MPTTMPRVMEIATPLGEDLLFHGMHAHEEIEPAVRVPARFAEREAGRHRRRHSRQERDREARAARRQHPLLQRLRDALLRRAESYGRYIRYFAVVRPWLWFLTRTADCRIFQEMTVPDIVKKVFGEEPTNDFKFELTSKYRKWTYCVQYRETDFNFVSRLMEQEGIYYYFRHTDGHNTVVLTDSTGKHVADAGLRKDPVHRARAGRQAGARAHQQLGLRA